MRKAFLASCGIALLGASLLAAFQLIGSHVDEDGVLREPFALLPTGLMVLALGIVGIAVSLFVGRRR